MWPDLGCGAPVFEDFGTTLGCETLCLTIPANTNAWLFVATANFGIDAGRRRRFAAHAEEEPEEPEEHHAQPAHGGAIVRDARVLRCAPMAESDDRAPWGAISDDLPQYGGAWSREAVPK